MSESTFRAVIAAVLVGALVLASVVVLALLPKPASPEPTTTATPTASRTSPSPIATPAGPAFGKPGVVSAGLVEPGTASPETLTFEFVEASEAAIPHGPGSFDVVLVDRDGSESTVAFTGSPVASAPGSLGLTVALAAPNVLRVSIVDSDALNVEPISVSGLGIAATSSAAAGPVTATIRNTTGSLATPFAGTNLPSPATVTAGS